MTRKLPVLRREENGPLIAGGDGYGAGIVVAGEVLLCLDTLRRLGCPTDKHMVDAYLVACEDMRRGRGIRRPSRTVARQWIDRVGVGTVHNADAGTVSEVQRKLRNVLALLRHRGPHTQSQMLLAWNLISDQAEQFHQFDRPLIEAGHRHTEAVQKRARSKKGKNVSRNEDIKRRYEEMRRDGMPYESAAMKLAEVFDLDVRQIKRIIAPPKAKTIG
jgi:hypothetical protein